MLKSIGQQFRFFKKNVVYIASSDHGIEIRLILKFYHQQAKILRGLKTAENGLWK